MAFTTLEDRYNQVSQQIYNRFSPSSDQLVVVKPNTDGVFGSKSRIKSDSRLLPLVSTARDISRITRFLASTEGALFLGKQLLLQTGNTFVETRKYNPLEVLVNTDPFVGRGTPRHIPTGKNILSSLSNKTPTRDLRGALQQETLNKFSGNEAGRVLLAPKLTEYFSDPRKEYYLRPEDIEFYGRPIKLTWQRNGRFSFYEEGQLYDTLGSRQFEVQPRDRRGDIKRERNYVTNFVQRFQKYAIQRPQPIVPGSKTFKELENTANTNGYFLGKLLDAQNLSPDIDNATIAAQNIFPGSQTKYPAIVDPYNGIRGVALDPIGINEDGTTRVDTPVRGGASVDTSLYKFITGDPKDNPVYENADKTDIIKFSFTTNLKNAEPVHFRAFLSSLKQNVKPEFNEQRYVGRTERFVTYGGARRTATLQFNIAAFSQTEIDQAWARVNYLTGLAFPLGTSTSGFMIPPLFRITIGGIYDDQPCYIDNLDFDFLDDSITFDIDKEVSQVITVNMSIVLLEKRSRFYNSPFYKITQDLDARIKLPPRRTRQSVPE